MLIRGARLEVTGMGGNYPMYKNYNESGFLKKQSQTLDYDIQNDYNPEAI